MSNHGHSGDTVIAQAFERVQAKLHVFCWATTCMFCLILKRVPNIENQEVPYKYLDIHFFFKKQSVNRTQGRIMTVLFLTHYCLRGLLCPSKQQQKFF